MQTSIQAITAEMIAAKYEQVREESESTGALLSRAETLWWVSRGEVQQVDTVLLEDASNPKIPGTQPVVQIREKGYRILVITAVLLDAGQPEADDAFEEHNRRVLSAYEKVSQLEPDDLWPSETLRGMKRTLRRLYTEATP